MRYLFQRISLALAAATLMACGGGGVTSAPDTATGNNNAKALAAPNGMPAALPVPLNPAFLDVDCARPRVPGGDDAKEVEEEEADNEAAAEEATRNVCDRLVGRGPTAPEEGEPTGPGALAAALAMLA